jgi:Tol biopolymer transport system component
MKRYFALLLLCTTQLFGGISSKTDTQEFENLLAARRPVETPHGIVVSDNFGSSLSLITATGTIQLAAAPGIGSFVSYSPDKSTLGVKIIEADGKQTPALIDIASGRITGLTTPGERCGEVSFSNDAKIAYAVGENLVVQNGTTSTSYPLGVYANLAPISPDGRRAAFNNIDDQIFILDLATGQKMQLTSLPRGYFNPLWSPDALKLLYSSLGGDLFVYDLQSQQTYTLENGNSPCWSPDGTTILYAKSTTERERLINSDIWSCRFDGTERKQLTSTADQCETDPSFSSDGNSILCAQIGKNIVKRLQVAEKKSGVELAQAAFYQPALQPQRVSLEAVKAPILDTINLPYVNQVYDTPDWHSGGSSCAPTAASMVLAYYKIIPPWNIWVSWPSPGHYSPYGSYVADKYLYREYFYADQAMDASDVTPAWGGYGYMWSTGSPHTRMAGYYANHNISAGQSEAPPYSEATTEIYAGRPYTLCVMLTTAGHLIIARGIYADHTLVFNDPYGNKNLPGSYKSPYGKGVTYDWPGYNNGFQNLTGVAWCIRTQYTAPAISDTLVDDLQFYNGFTLSFTSPASYSMWKDRNGTGWNNHFWYVKTKGSNTSDTCFAAWQPNLSKDGSYEVFAYIPFSNSTTSRYKITHRDSIQTVIANQKAYKNAWMSLGTYNFTKGTAGSVRLGDQSDTAGQEIVFDAMRWSYRGPMAVSILKQSEQTPAAFELLPAYPNPFNPSTRIRFSLPAAGFSTMTIYDVLGREQETIMAQMLTAGTYSVEWNAANHSSGIYFCRLSVMPLAQRDLVPTEDRNGRTAGRIQTIKLVLQK